MRQGRDITVDCGLENLNTLLNRSVTVITILDFILGNFLSKGKFYKFM